MGDGFDLSDEIEALQDIHNYIIQNEHDLHSENPAHLLEGGALISEDVPSTSNTVQLQVPSKLSQTLRMPSQIQPYLTSTVPFSNTLIQFQVL
jgi:hypothetical protein